MHNTRAAAQASPVLRAGVYRFAYRLSGSGGGLVLGVCDASKPKQPADAAWAWGVHLTTGALYTKTGKNSLGTLSTKQLLSEVLEVDADGGEPVGTVLDIEVEVDMERRRLAFGVADRPMVEAPVVLTWVLSAARPAGEG